MYILITSLTLVNLIALASFIYAMCKYYLKSQLNPQVKQYVTYQYNNMLGYNYSRLINEFNKEFLPDTCNKTKLIQYQKFLKKIREKKINPADFVDVKNETYPNLHELSLFATLHPDLAQITENQLE